MVTDPSHSLRMMVDVFLIMTPFPPIVILNGGKNAVGERRGNGIVTQSEESITLHDGSDIMKEND